MDIQQGTFGGAVRKARLDKKLTQERLAEIIGITPMHIKQLESERRNPSVPVLFKLVTALDLSLDSLFSESGDEAQAWISKINVCLDQCSVHELQVAYATIEAMLKKE